ncbi:hypothetical protein [Nonomuraea basaltis]|nr:hypothetical protein [Nonomuraea basaltis]
MRKKVLVLRGNFGLSLACEHDSPDAVTPNRNSSSFRFSSALAR